jgi:transketolase
MAAELDAMRKGALPPGWESGLPSFDPDPKGVASRESAGKVLNALAGNVPWLVGGSADLSPSTKTELKDFGPFQADNPGGRTMHFGVREHAMGAIANGMALSYIKPFAATFLVFADYMRAPVRLAAIMELPVTFVFTHDSIGVGEDGPTHQPIEHLATLRATPGLDTIRPGDANEAAEAWKLAVRQTRRPSALILSRQALPTLDRSRFAAADNLRRGGYVLDDDGTSPALILIASGSEVHLVVEAAQRLRAQEIAVRCVSMPSWELFDAQSREYRDGVLPPTVRARLAVEAGATQGWWRYVGDAGDVLGVDRFGASAPGDTNLREYGFSVDHVCERALKLLRQLAATR